MSNLSPKSPLAALLLRSVVFAAPAAILSACVAQIGVEGLVGGYAAPGYVEVQAREAPPPLPDYDQPPCPEDGFLSMPGYWSWGGGGYFWVPGTWVHPPVWACCGPPAIGALQVGFMRFTPGTGAACRGLRRRQ